MEILNYIIFPSYQVICKQIYSHIFLINTNVHRTILSMFTKWIQKLVNEYRRLAALLHMRFELLLITPGE